MNRPGISAATTVVGVMGDPVAHSLSPLLHNTAFAALGLDWVSVGFAVPGGQAPAAVAGAQVLGIRGLSVTMPHKEAVVGLCDELSPSARRLAAVNCLSLASGRVVGHNTDGEGVTGALARGAGLEVAGRAAMVLGAGGAARAAVLALAGAGAAEVVVVNRTPWRAEAAAALAAGAGRVGTAADAASVAVVVQATPAGMAGTASSGDEPPVPGAALGPGQVALDLVYHPRRTSWLEAAAGAGATPVEGVGVLVHQAAAQLRVFTGQEPPVAAMWAAVSGGEGAAADP